MTHQPSFSQAEFADKKKITRREKFLARMEAILPWSRLLAVIEPFYPKGERGRPPVGLERRLRMYFLQQWHGLADEALEDALYDRQALRGFARMDLAAEGVPDAPTLLKFRRLLETHDLCKGLFTAINADRAARGLLLREGTLVDATLIAAPPSTKNQEKQRDPERHQTRKGNQWYFGMKAHIGADRDSKLVHTVVVTAANVADLTKTAELLHGQETQVHADAGCTGVEKRAEIAALKRPVDWQIARKRGQIKTMAEGAEKERLKASEKAKASVRALVEHPFHILKNLFRHRKVRYRGLAKNGHQRHTLFGLANLVIGARQATA
ncbi:MAG TPA: IS5 family transposase [Candidatus Limnocylindrales bacterium]|nr:IS5 family transposase [Candidatus Limnocylindrales bacterium]